MGNTIWFVLFFVSLAGFFPDSANGACCPCFNEWIRSCRDGTTCTPCCGYRRCNFFCCNCVCRGIRNWFGSIGAPDGFENMDQDGDGFVNKTEARIFLANGGCGNSTEKLTNFDEMFAMHDNNGDDVLSYDEIDSDD